MNYNTFNVFLPRWWYRRGHAIVGLQPRLPGITQWADSLSNRISVSLHSNGKILLTVQHKAGKFTAANVNEIVLLPVRKLAHGDALAQRVNLSPKLKGTFHLLYSVGLLLSCIWSKCCGIYCYVFIEICKNFLLFLGSLVPTPWRWCYRHVIDV